MGYFLEETGNIKLRYSKGSLQDGRKFLLGNVAVFINIKELQGIERKM